MNRILRIAGIVIIIAGVICLLAAALQLYGYYHVMDGSAQLYHRLHRNAMIFAAVGLVLAAAGAACLLMRLKR